MSQELPKQKEGESTLDYLTRVSNYWKEQEKWDKVQETAEQIVEEVRGKQKTRKSSKRKAKKEKPLPKEEYIELQRPVRTEGESLGDYMKRLKEWKKKIKRKGLKTIGEDFNL